MQQRKYRVPLSVDTTVSATFFVEAGSPGEAVAVARVRLLEEGRVMLGVDCPTNDALMDAHVAPNHQVEEISEAYFLGEPTPENADSESGLTPIELERYLLFDGSICPFCGAWDIEGRAIEIECACAYQAVRCNQCSGSWMDRYRLAVEGPFHVHRPDRTTIETALRVNRSIDP